MSKEIERKFLVKKDLLPVLTDSVNIIQGYLSTDPVVRIRIESNEEDAIAYITIKGKGLVTRDEYEYGDIIVSEAHEMMKLCRTKIEKTRYVVPIEGEDDIYWEIDFFKDSDLILAEIEIPSEDYRFDLPEWLGEEVTLDSNYSNVKLAK